MEPQDHQHYRSPPQGSDRRRFLKLGLGLGGAVAAGVLAGRFLAPLFSQPSSNRGTDTGSDYLDLLNQNVVSGGPGKDGIPSVDDPKFISPSEADGYLEPGDVVFGIDVEGEARAYPQRVLVWHEIVNDSFKGRRISVTYCPLTGSQLAFEGQAADGSPLTFGTTGSLVNSNLLMYDRQTDSTWPQILATSIGGSRRSESLRALPLAWTTWAMWKALHPDTVVLSTNTGFLRNYSYDPYGSYDLEPQSNDPTGSFGLGASNYYDSPELWFPVINRSERFHPKKIVIGVRLNGGYLAVPLAEFRSVAVDNVQVGGEPIALLYDARLDTVGAFMGSVEGSTLSFERRGDEIVDAQTESVWSADGFGVEGSYEGASLSRVTAFNVMWFAWFAFHPETEVW